MSRKNQGYKNATTVKLQGLELEVNHKDRQIFFLERSKEARKHQLKEFIHNHLRQRWLTIAKSQATLEKKFVQDLIYSL